MHLLHNQSSTSLSHLYHSAPLHWFLPHLFYSNPLDCSLPHCSLNRFILVQSTNSSTWSIAALVTAPKAIANPDSSLLGVAKAADAAAVTSLTLSPTSWWAHSVWLLLKYFFSSLAWIYNSFLLSWPTSGEQNLWSQIRKLRAVIPNVHIIQWVNKKILQFWTYHHKFTLRKSSIIGNMGGTGCTGIVQRGKICSK